MNEHVVEKLELGAELHSLQSTLDRIEGMALEEIKEAAPEIVALSERVENLKRVAQ